MRRILIMFLLMLFLTACAQDPWKADQIKAQAEADQVAAQSLQDSLNQEANRQHADQLFQIEKQQKELELGRSVATETTKRNGLNMFWQALFITLTAAVVFVIFYSARVYQYTAQGMAQAAVQAADIKSRLIPLDPRTGQYPLLIEHIGRGLVTLTDPNTGTVLKLDTRQAGDRQMIDGAMSIRHTYILSEAARRSKDPTGVSIIQAPRQYRNEIIDLSDDTQKAGDDE